MKSNYVALFSVLTGILVAGCGRAKTYQTYEKEDVTAEATPGIPPVKVDPFPESLLSDFLKWTPVLNGDTAFKSQGHGGILVKGYLNSLAVESATAEKPYPLKVGSVLAKAVVTAAEDSPNVAERVYFMRKMPSGFDPKNNDWAYAVSNHKQGKLVFDAKVGQKEQLCVSCHVKFKAFDYVKTVQFFMDQSAI